MQEEGDKLTSKHGWERILTNCYAGVDVSNITGGVLNLTRLLKGNNILCFVFEVAKTASPNSLSGLFSIAVPPLRFLADALSTALLDLSCHALKDLTVGGESFTKGIQKKFPGAKINASL
ncbi:hypothetical protein FSPOR_3129 [Fusarium sporotrichioides]|uniref:Uncharacterized protein n=1 Tax=Fusarium sporotrichioides TaxID=5514 RepID=A0A395SH47_FUSSP|nr:hypothetical protein FSPOR_3129 [Fusarium sporotrichioides]